MQHASPYGMESCARGGGFLQHLRLISRKAEHQQCARLVADVMQSHSRFDSSQLSTYQSTSRKLHHAKLIDLDKDIALW